MEVASPLPLHHSQTGTKRRLACSPPIGDNVGINMEVTDFDMLDDSANCPKPFKRRRFHQNENMESISSPNTNAGKGLSPSPFSMMSSGNLTSKSSFLSPQKRSRVSSSSSNDSRNLENSLSLQKAAANLQRLVDTQAIEIDRLKSDKSSVEESFSELKSTHKKVVEENKILKRAVTIQQERQNHAASELEAARRFKVDAEERIRRLEQMNLTLKYHLQAQQPCAGNDILGFGPRPPDVF